MRLAISRRARIAQTCFGSSGRVCPIVLPLFRGMCAGRIIRSLKEGMTVPPNIETGGTLFGSVRDWQFAAARYRIASNAAPGSVVRSRPTFVRGGVSGAINTCSASFAPLAYLLP